MDKLINYQNDLFKRISKGRVNFKKSPKERLCVEYVEGRLESLDQLRVEFLAGHKELLRNYESDALKDYIIGDIYEKFEEMYLDYKGELKLKLTEFGNLQKTVDTHTSNTSAQVRLPKITIPPFSGKYSEWSTFRDLFRSLVHNNNSLTNVQKLMYLKGYLTGEAEQLISQICITENNYFRSWQLLEERYNNRKYICHQSLYKLLNLRKLNIESASGLKELVDSTDDCLATLANLKIDISSWDILVIFLLCTKLDSETRRQWEFYVNSNIAAEDLPSYSQFKEFLTQRFRAIEFLNPTAGYSNKAQNSNVKNNFNKFKSMHITTSQCPLCNEEHNIYSCDEFRKKSVEARRQFVQTNNICYCCLKSNHLAKNCKSNFRCNICKCKHHFLLHPAGEETFKGMVARTVTPEPDTSVDIGNSSGRDSPLVACFTKNSNQILLATALVNTMRKDGSMQTIRALLDQGSQTSFITEGTVQQLGTRKSPSNIAIIGVGGDKTLTSKAIVYIEIKSRTDPNFIIKVRACVIKSITSPLPCTRLRDVGWTELQEMTLADPCYHTPNRIDMLLGAEVYAQILRVGLKRSPNNSLVAQDTCFGWILSGAMETTDNVTCKYKVMHTLENNNLLKKFWELEDDIPLSKEKLLTEDEELCERIFNTTTKRDETGRYIVRLPLKNPTPEVDNSLRIAERRLYSLEKRLKNGDLKNKYKEVIDEYILLNHMELVPEREIDNPKAIYLPHHAVVRDDKQTTKVRAVFDASCRGTNNRSLNDNLLVGPTLQSELRHLVMRWRVQRICLTADIVKMYRQIKVAEEDIDLQRILWRGNTDEDIKHYRMLRVTFGVASAPYLAVKALQQLSKDEGEILPLASKAVVSQFYIDDLLACCENVNQGMTLFQELNELLAKGGFKLQKWTSNSNELVQKMKDCDRKKKEVITREEEIEEELKIKTDDVIKIVGLTWNRSADSFNYNVDVPDDQSPATKRSIISEICRFYDPLGWVAPSIIISKILIQKLWLAGIDWDEIVPVNILNEWKHYKHELKGLSNVYVPRWLGIRSGDIVELHGFCDASKDAYGAVVYARVVNSEGHVHVSLVTAKTKVAPVKQISIPRLELCGAVLLTRLMVEVASEMEVEKTYLHAWTDSNVVLAWLNNHPSRWKVFVANRVSEVIQSLESHHWSYVSSKCNPADVASRGQSPGELVKNTMWFRGPDFLHKDEIEYTKPKVIDTDVEKVKVKPKAFLTAADCPIFERFSSLTRMVRVIAYCKRFIYNLKVKKEERRLNFLTAEELNNTLKACIVQCQRENFTDDIEIIKKGQNLPKRSTLRSLNPFLDQEGILRVGGRLELSPLTEERKHPILIAKESHMANLLVRDAHTQTLHGGPQLMLGYLRTKYWIMSGGRLVKTHFRRCVTCVKNIGKTQIPLMGQLPAVRTRPSRPFKSSGVDYAGPIQIRTAKGRGHRAHKGYICLFVCLVTRAIHLEVVTELTTEGFLQAYKRFVSRRGHCSEIWSDNATNFTGAASELHRLFKNERGSMVQEVAESLATNGCTWHFIPAQAPNFGGLWEAGVKSVKYHLKRTIGSSTLTFEEMTTVLAQIEACLNSRPLSVITEDNEEDFTVLTPGHFLVGEALITPPDYNFEMSTISSLRRWQYTQRITQAIWRLWSRQYLNRLYKRYRGAEQIPQLKVGDVVTVREDNLPVSRWLYGRVIATHPGQDNIVRVATLKVKNGTIKRPVNKLCVLPIAD